MNLPEPESNQTTPNYKPPFWTDIKTLSNLAIAGELTQIQRLSPIALAYIGDAVYELYIRTRFLMPPKRMADYHDRVVSLVRAESQAAYLTVLEPDLTPLEKEILRRGRNATVGRSRRLARNIYQQASSFETLIGYLFLRDLDRLEKLFDKLEPLFLKEEI